MTTWKGQRLRDARGRLRHPDGRPWTQAETAAAIGAAPRTYTEWERDRATPQAHWNVKLDELFADVAPPDNAPGDPAQIQRRLTELLAEALTLVTQLDRQPRAATHARDPGATPERVQFRSADAPSANRESGGNQQDEAQ